jgi:hypothetical protein
LPFTGEVRLIFADGAQVEGLSLVVTIFSATTHLVTTPYSTFLFYFAFSFALRKEKEDKRD